VSAKDDAERVTCGVGEDSESCLALARDAGSTQGEQFLLGLADVADADIEVQLLGIGGVRPAWWNPLGDLLKGKPDGLNRRRAEPAPPGCPMAL
jgi:hypothetical protein